MLYVEDHAVNTILMQSIFRHRPGLELSCATSGIAALRRVELLQPRLLLLAIHLPDCHGAELLARLRELAHCASVPAIAVTSDDSFDIRPHGFRERWTKPLDVRGVLRRLDELLGESAEREASAA